MAFASSPDRLSPSVTSAKIVVAGGFGVGKTTLVGTVSEIPPVNTEAWMTQAGKSFDPLTGSDEKTTTTVAMDFGRRRLGHDLILYLFGTPGQPRFWPMWDDLCRGASAALVLVDTRRLDVSFPAVNYFENDSDVPFVVAVNLFNGMQTHPLDQVRDALGVAASVPLVTVDARDRRSAVHALLASLTNTMEKTSPVAARLSSGGRGTDSSQLRSTFVRKILIVGAGQSGLQLALCLQAEGYDVTVMSARTPDEIRDGWPTSTQVMFWPALDREREYNLNLWENVVTPIEGASLAVAATPGEQAFSFYGAWDHPGNSVDQRVKMATWLELFEERGGRAIYHSVMTSDLAGLAAMYDLTIIAAGKGEIVELFDRDASRSKYTSPGRHLAAIYMNGVDIPADLPIPAMRANIAPGGAEVYYMPAYTHSGSCDIVLVEAIPGGPFDIFADRPSPDEHLRRTKALLNQYFPWEGELYANAEPTDARASLVGRFTTTVRHPYAEVAPGSYVLGIGDVVVVNDPISGQGANNAAHSAGIYLKSILERGDRPFDPQWMQQTFDTFWTRAQDSILWTEILLEPLPQHGLQFLAAAAQFPEAAYAFAQFFPFPSTLHDFLTDPEKTAAYLESLAAAR